MVALTACRHALSCALVCATVLATPGGAVAQGAQLRLSSSSLVHVRAPGMQLLEGRVLDRLRDGRSVQVEAVLDVRTRAGGPAVARATQTCTFSFDLWEERFAVRSGGQPRRSISHLRADEAETWCVDQLVLPLASLGEGARTRPFWIRLDLSAEDPDSGPAGAEPSGGLSLERIIDVFSQRRHESHARRTLEAGPLRVAP